MSKKIPKTTISRSKSAALTRVLDHIPRGYTRYITGTIGAEKASSLIRKFHDLYTIGATPSQRITRKQKGDANAILVVYWPVEAQLVEWMLLFTPGIGTEREPLHQVDTKPRLNFLGYELVRHTARAKSKPVWTWKRSKEEMQEHYALLGELLRKHHTNAVADMMQRLARQPGFNGVRAQSKELFEAARIRGYRGELPHLFYLRKISHGESAEIL